MIKIFTIGKLDKKYLQQANQDFLNRLQHYCKVEIIELTEITKYSVEQNVEQQSKELTKILYDYNNYFKILLAIKGQLISSANLAELIKKQKDYSNNKILFIIGGSNGLNNSIEKMVNLNISFGRITLPHQLCRVILLEQIYRAYTIYFNHQYHK